MSSVAAPPRPLVSGRWGLRPRPLVSGRAGLLPLLSGRWGPRPVLSGFGPAETAMAGPNPDIRYASNLPTPTGGRPSGSGRS